jgi:hypothetical protein
MKLKRRKPTPFLNRYTTLPVLLDILVKKQIVLLNPSSWEDRNDSHYLERYKADKKLKTVVALCFAKKRETFHHWKIFSGGSAGVCIEFDKDMLLSPLSNKPGFVLKDVDYRLIKDVQETRPPISEWPFLKRKPFEDEGEFRIVFESKTEELPVKEVPIPLACIKKVTLSPWMPASVAETCKTVIRSINECQKLQVERSSLLETSSWKAAIKPKTSAAAV